MFHSDAEIVMGAIVLVLALLLGGLALVLVPYRCLKTGSGDVFAVWLCVAVLPSIAAYGLLHEEMGGFAVLGALALQGLITIRVLGNWMNRKFAARTAASASR